MQPFSQKNWFVMFETSIRMKLPLYRRSRESGAFSGEFKLNQDIYVSPIGIQNLQPTASYALEFIDGIKITDLEAMKAMV
ncbi:MAG: hypothetical protein IPJ74_25230 [Saprospiraceae bacterium]|nr:hypothetical protein [Saprospiraceae bacterium]